MIALLVARMCVGKDHVHAAIVGGAHIGPVRRFPDQNGLCRIDDGACLSPTDGPVDLVGGVVCPQIDVVPDVCDVVYGAQLN